MVNAAIARRVSIRAQAPTRPLTASTRSRVETISTSAAAAAIAATASTAHKVRCRQQIRIDLHRARWRVVLASSKTAIITYVSLAPKASTSQITTLKSLGVCPRLNAIISRAFRAAVQPPKVPAIFVQMASQLFIRMRPAATKSRASRFGLPVASGPKWPIASAALGPMASS